MPAGGQARDRGVSLLRIAPVEDDGGAMLGKPRAIAKPDALTRSGDERALAREIEQFECHGQDLLHACG